MCACAEQVQLSQVQVVVASVAFYRATTWVFHWVFHFFFFALRLLKVVKHKTLPLNTSSSNEIRVVAQPSILFLPSPPFAGKQIEVEVCGSESFPEEGGGGVRQHATVFSFSVFLKCFSNCFFPFLHWRPIGLCFVLFGLGFFNFIFLFLFFFWLLALRFLTALTLNTCCPLPITKKKKKLFLLRFLFALAWTV